MLTPINYTVPVNLILVTTLFITMDIMVGLVKAFSKTGFKSLKMREGRVVNNNIVHIDSALTMRRTGLLEKCIRATVLAEDFNKGLSDHYAVICTNVT